MIERGTEPFNMFNMLICLICYVNMFGKALYRSLTPGWKFTKLLTQIQRFFVTLGLKILRLFKLKVVFEADIIKG